MYKISRNPGTVLHQTLTLWNIEKLEFVLKIRHDSPFFRNFLYIHWQDNVFRATTWQPSLRTRQYLTHAHAEEKKFTIANLHASLNSLPDSFFYYVWLRVVWLLWWLKNFSLLNKGVDRGSTRPLMSIEPKSFPSLPTAITYKWRSSCIEESFMTTMISTSALTPYALTFH